MKYSLPAKSARYPFVLQIELIFSRYLVKLHPFFRLKLFCIAPITAAKLNKSPAGRF
jgi:hypothetical protein